MGRVSAPPVPGQDRPREAEPHLREVLESHPVALLRVDVDGKLLAVNQLALAQLGARSLEEILGSSLVELVIPDERQGCQSLLARAAKGERGTLDVDVVGLTGTRQTVELRAVAYPAAPDGVVSALVSMRDVTDARRLAQSLVEAVATQNEQGLAHATERSQLLADLELARQAQSGQAQATAQLTELEQRLAALNEERTALQAGHDTERSRLLAELDVARQAGSRQAEFEAQLGELQRRLGALQEERAALQTSYDAEVARLRESHDVERRQSAADMAAAVEGLNAINEELAQLRGRYEALESERGQSIEESGRLRAESEARQRSVDALTGQLAALDVERQAALASANDLRRALDEHQAQAAVLASRVKAVDTELTSVRQAAEAEKTAIRAASDSSLRALEARYASDTDALRNALNDAMEEQARLAQSVAKAEEEAARTAGQIEVFERTLAERDAAHEARVRELESRHREQSAGIEAAGAARLQEAEARLAEATSQRQRLEEALATSVEAERTAQSALTAEVASRSQAERTRADLLKAIGRLAEEANQHSEPAAAPVSDAEPGDAPASAGGRAAKTGVRRLFSRAES